MSTIDSSSKDTYVATPLAGKLALITGATYVFLNFQSISEHSSFYPFNSGGIGKATAQLLATRGVHLALHYRSSVPAAEELAASLAQAHGIRARAYRCDLGDFDAVTSYCYHKCPHVY